MVFKTNYHFNNAGQKYCRMLQGEHSANTFELHLATNCYLVFCFVYFGVAVLNTIYCMSYELRIDSWKEGFSKSFYLKLHVMFCFIL